MAAAAALDPVATARHAEAAAAAAQRAARTLPEFVRTDLEQRAWAVLGRVMDPEVPVVSLIDLGIVRELSELPVPVSDRPAAPQGQGVHVVLTPTYSGCPATELIETLVHEAMARAGITRVSIERRLAPAWSSAWISPGGRAALRDYGIVPPVHDSIVGMASRGACGGSSASAGSVVLHFVPREQFAPLDCPRCDSRNTERISAFGSTACKALYRCRACREPFEYFKPI
ncbi:MAG: phenylacetate-CoA oxygenase subunit PaaJ [Burkholderiales bacterium]|nr:phenylacetate-CoA oxygenase subunit PaaJ [Burkholderiales bacterium]